MNIMSLIKEDKVFSTFYISGTAIAIASAMVTAIIAHILLSDISPEINRSRTVYIDNCSFSSDESKTVDSYDMPEFRQYGISLRFLELCRQTISGIEACTVYRKDQDLKVSGQQIYDDGIYRKEEARDMIYANSDFFKIYNLDFVCGRPFSDKAVKEVYRDYLDGVETWGEAVITEDIAIECFGSAEEAIGKTLYTYGRSDYMVVGVVKRVSSLLYNACADIYASTKCLYEPKVSGADAGNLAGNYNNAFFLLSDDADVKTFREEFRAMMGKYEKQLSDLYHLNIKFRGVVRDHFGHAIGTDPNVADDNNMSLFSAMIAIIMLLLLLLPAINLTGFVNNRMREQLPELGIRKTYGASKISLLGYVFKQNMIMTVCGGILGYPLAMAFISAMSNTEISRMIITQNNYAAFHGGVDMAMFFTPGLFLTAFGCCFVLTSLAALIPAINALRKPIVESLNLQR